MLSCRSRLTTLPAAIAAMAVSTLLVACRDSPATDAAAVKPARQDGVAGLGRIEAGDGVVRLATRSLGGQASIAARLFVREGDKVGQGQIVAELDSKPELEAAMHQAAAAIDVARKRLEQAKAGAKPSEIAAQRADVDRLQREVENAQTDLERHKSLGSNVTAAELDRLQLRVDSSSRTLMSAQQRLAGLEQVRPVDVAVVESELQQAIRVEARARAEYDASIIHSPIAGRVIKIHAHAGEAVGTDGLLELAPIDPMYAVAEIAESDISRVKPGQKATVTGDGLAAPVQGVVERVGTKVLQNQIMPVDPANFSDARVVEVWVKLESPKAVEDLIHLRVDVVIRP